MSAVPWSARDLVVGLLTRAGRAQMPSLVDPALHGAVLAAVRRGSRVTGDPALAGHRPDALTVRRITGLDAALSGLAREGTLTWRDLGWGLRPRERMASVAHLTSVSSAEVAALDEIVLDWSARRGNQAPTGPSAVRQGSRTRRQARPLGESP